jgi:hypothetical protein
VFADPYGSEEQIVAWLLTRGWVRSMGDHGSWFKPSGETHPDGSGGVTAYAATTTGARDAEVDLSDWPNKETP